MATFDEIQANNKKIKDTNIPEGAMTYQQYLTASGINPNADMNAAVEEAERAYDRALGTYGASGEALGAGGLGASGYADYLNSSAYAAKQGAIDTARATKKLTESVAQSSYLGYLDQYRNNQANVVAGAMSDMVNLGLSGDAAQSYADALGLTGASKDSALGFANTYAEYIKAQEEKAKAEALAEEEKIKNDPANVANNLLTAKNALGSVYDESDAQRVLDMYGITDEAQRASLLSETAKTRLYNNLINAGDIRDAKNELSVKALADAYGLDTQTAKEIVQSANAAIEKAIKENTDEEKEEEITIDIGADAISNVANTFTQIPNIMNNLLMLSESKNKQYEKAILESYGIEVDGKNRSGDLAKIIKNELTNAGISASDADVKQIISAPSDSERTETIYKIYINNLSAEGYSAAQIGKIMELISRRSGTAVEFAAVADYIASLEN